MIMAGLRHTLFVVGSGVVLGAGVLGVGTGIATGDGVASAAPCVQQIQPLNPYLQTCGIPNQPVTVPGSSPGAGAIIACRNQPGCLSQVINGPGIIQVPQPDTRVRQSQ
ncbi:MAG: hypothetical protein QOK02_862 [Mycobacterium sp.]|jgi:hypothetical protein|nr:hypothetical protein [Mycobacterium sp.]